MRRSLLVLGVVLLLPAMALGVLVTPWGLRIAAGFVPGLELEDARLQLPPRLTATRISLTDARGAWVTAEGADIALNWRELPQWRVTLEHLRATRLIVHRLPPGSPADASSPTPSLPSLPSLPNLPLAIRVNRIDLPRIELSEAVVGQSAALSLAGFLSLDAARLASSLNIQRLDRPGAATLELAVEGETLVVRLDASEPAGGLIAALSGLPDAPFAANLALDGPASGAPWSLRARLGDAEADLSGMASVSPTGGMAITIGGHAIPGPLVPAEFRVLAERISIDAGVARTAAGGVTMERLALAMPALRATASGTLDTSQVLRGNFSLQAAGPATFGAWLPPGITWRALGAEGGIGGTLTAPELTLAVLAEAPRGLGAADALLGDALRLAVEATAFRIDARLEGARLRASLAGPIAAPLDLAFTLQAHDPPTLNGTIAAQGRITGPAEAPRLHAQIRSDRLAGMGQVFEALTLTADGSLADIAIEATGRFQSRPLNLSLHASRVGEVLRVDRLEARFAEATLTGAGAGSLPAGPFTGALRLNAPDLGRLQLGLAGRQTAELEAAAIPGATGPAAQGLRLRLAGSGAGTPTLRANVEAEVGGSLAALAFRLAMTAPQAVVDLAGNLALGEASLITLSRLEARSGPDGLSLQGGARIRVTPAGDLTLEMARLASRRGGMLAVQGRLAGGSLNGRADVSALPLGPYTANAVTGTASAQVLATGTLAAPVLDATLRADGLRARDAAQVPPGQLNATARLQGEALRAEARLSAGPGVELNVTAQQPRGLGMASPFDAVLRGRLDLGALARPFLAGSPNSVGGRLALDLRASGIAAAPQLAGGATLSEGSFANPLYGTRIESMAARLKAQGPRLVVESLTGRTGGGGTLAVQGWIEPLGDGLPAELRLRADAARPISGAVGDAVVDADLLLRGPLLSGGNLGGRISLRRADLRIPESLPASVPNLGPVRQVGPLPPGRPAPAQPRPVAARPNLPMALDVTIAATRAIFIRGRGLEAELGGELVLRGTLAAPIPSGGLRLRRGSFDLAGRTLQFSRGVIGFDSASLSPSLDFLASTRSRSHTINLGVTGTPAMPVITVTAEPELPQDEALARLLFDRETSRLSPFEIITIAQAAAQLAGLPAPGGGVADRLRRSLGLDRLGVGGDGRGGAALEAGSYVAPGVYFGVRQGTGGGAPGVGVQVELTPRLRLEGQTSTGPAGDRLGLTWEREY